MHQASQTQPAIDSPPAVVAPALSRRAAILWLLQLVLPTIALFHVVIWIIDPLPLGRFGYLLLVFCLLWYAVCFLALALGAGRRWIATHPTLLVVLYVLIVPSLVAAEVAARNIHTGEYDPRAPHITKLSPDLGWSLNPGVADIGEHGWCLPYYPREKSPGHFRIVCIGDSATLSARCSWRDTWPHQLEVLLNQDADWTRSHGVTEVLNLGVLMYGPDQSLLALKNYGLSYSPDLVIFHLCSDDFADASFDYYWKLNYDTKMYKPFFVLKDGQLIQGRDHVPSPTDPSGKPRAYARKILPGWRLSLLSFLRAQGIKLLRGKAPKKQPDPMNYHWPIHDTFRDQYAAARPLVWALIKDMSRLSNVAGAGFVLTLSPCHMTSAEDHSPWRIASFRREYQQDAKAAGIPAFDCVSEYFAAGGNDRFQRDETSADLNAEGNAFIARSTYGRLKEQDSTGALGPKR
jgi:hypothetical protein